MKATIGNFLSQPNKDFPLDCETLGYINDNIALLALLGNIAGDKAILHGCDVSSGTRAAGYVFLKTRDYPDGEVAYFEGGTAATCYVKKEAVSVSANGDNYAQAYTVRSLASGIGAEQYAWADFSAVTTTAALKAALDALTAAVNALSAEPVGVVKLYAGSVAPANWAFCVGTDLSATEYAALHAVVGGAYDTAPNANGGNWVAPAAGRFRIPDLRGRFVVGRNESDTDYNANGKAGGEKKVALAEAQLPPHRHSVDDYFYAENPSVNSTLADGYANTQNNAKGNGPKGVAGDVSRYWYKTHGTAYAGSGQSHENRPPFYTLSYIIKVK